MTRALPTGPEPVSYLFVPGDRPDRFDKALATGADCVVIDLEDAVAPDHKNQARAAVQEFLRGPGETDRVALRVNAVDTPWHAEDVALLREFPGLAAMLPKTEPESLARFLRALSPTAARRGQGGRTVLALVETVDGYLNLRSLAQSGEVSRLVFGSVDFYLDAGMVLDEDSAAIAAVRLSFALESRFAGLPPPIDGVCTAVDDQERLRRESARARSAGFGGKLCIHPRQVETVSAAMRPDAAEVAWAERVIQAFERAGGAAVQLDGEMIDAPVAERARRVLAARR